MTDDLEIGPDYLGIAIRLAVANVGNAGGPFGAVVVTADGTVAYAGNRVTARHDPSAHAEVEAIRSAASLTRSHDLSGSILYSSCAPCPMCLTAALWARVDQIVYAASPEDAAVYGFDDADFHRAVATVANGPKRFDVVRSFGLSYAFLPIPVIHENRPDAIDPFAAWADNAERVHY